MMKGKVWKSSAVVLLAVFFIVACQTVPLQKIPAVEAYTNMHGITLMFPKTWHMEDATLKYRDLPAAAIEGGAYMQIYSYDSDTAAPGPEDRPRQPSSVHVAGDRTPQHSAAAGQRQPAAMSKDLQSS